MSDLPQSPSADDEFLGRIRVGRTLGSLSELVALIAAALLGLLFIVQAGPGLALGTSALWAGALLVAVLGAAVLNILELLGGSAEGSGSYALVHETTAGVTSFLTGWSILAISALAAGALARLCASILLVATNSDNLPIELVAATLVVLIALTHLFGWGRWRSLARALLVLAAVGLTATLLSLLAASPWQRATQLAVPQQDTLVLAARFSLLFVGIETLLLARRSVRSPRRDLPRAFSAALLLVLVLVAVPALLLARTAGGASDGLWQALRSASRIPTIVVDLSVAAALLLSLSTVFMNGVRTINAMARRGGLPAFLRGQSRPFPMPPGLFLAMAVMTVTALLTGSAAQDASAAAWLVLVTLILISGAAFYSRLSEPDRRRWIRLPLFPLVPAVALVGLVALVLQLPTRSHTVGLVWLAAGVIYYVLYARQQQVVAQAGVVTFGREEAADKPEDGYRVLVPLGEQKSRRFALDLSVALARQLKGDVMPLQVIPIPDPLAVEEGRRLARERNTLFQMSLRRGSRVGVNVTPVTRLARSVAEGIVDTAIEEHCDLILLPWAIEDGEVERSMGSVIDHVAMRATCDLAIVAYRPGQLESGSGEEGDLEPARHSIETILVPTSGGPHAPLAVGLALELAEEYGARVRSVYVGEEGLSERDRQAGEARIRSTLEEMRTAAAEILHHDLSEIVITPDEVEQQIVEASDVVEGIVNASAEADLTFIGSSEESFIDQVLFGSIPRQVAARADCPVIMVRRHRGLPRFWVQRLWDTVSGSVPTLSTEDQIEAYKRVRRGARPDADFFVMIGLSALIATLGLLLGSGAVIIGAMLVAPLFTPVLAFSMSIASGDVRILRLASEATLKGAILAIGLALLVAFLAPLSPEPLAAREIASRVRPNLLDLGVALASGAAGAYAIARKDVAAALPGVAIAAALVPPLGVVGIALAAGSLAGALGAALLVITNLIAISLSGALVLLMLGFRPGQRGERRARLKAGLVASLVLLAVVSIPLALVLFQTVQTSQLEQMAQTALEQHAEQLGSGIEVAQTELREERGVLFITATLYVPATVDQPPVQEFQDAIASETGRPVSLRLLVLPVLEAPAR